MVYWNRPDLSPVCLWKVPLARELVVVGLKFKLVVVVAVVRSVQRHDSCMRPIVLLFFRTVIEARAVLIKEFGLKMGCRFVASGSLCNWIRNVFH